MGERRTYQAEGMACGPRGHVNHKDDKEAVWLEPRGRGWEVKLESGGGQTTLAAEGSGSWEVY